MRQVHARGIRALEVRTRLNAHEQINYGASVTLVGLQRWNNLYPSISVEVIGGYKTKTARVHDRRYALFGTFQSSGKSLVADRIIHASVSPARINWPSKYCQRKSPRTPNSVRDRHTATICLMS